MSQQMRDKIDYVVACVNEFSAAHGLDRVAGFDYLKNHDGIAFLERNYAVERSYRYSIIASSSEYLHHCR